MTKQEELLAKTYLEHKDAEKRASERAQDCLEELKELSPHKVGEIIRWTEQERQKNVGSWLYPVFKTVPAKECSAVLTSVNVSVSTWSKLIVHYDYTFSPITKSGGVSKTHCYVGQTHYEWTGEIHKNYIKEENI